MKKSFLTALIFFSLAALSLSLCLFSLADSSDNLYTSVIRIHVLANSDEKDDQERKLLVRDRILSYAKETFSSLKTKEEAKEAVLEHMDAITNEEKMALAEAGCQDSVQITLGEEYYPTREYDALSLPAGNYLSLRVQIGKAQGQNWWCVLFPPLCINSAIDTEDALLDAGMSKDNAKTVLKEGKKYEYRFKILEIWEETKKNWQSLF